MFLVLSQGHRRFSNSGTAIECHRHSARAKGLSRRCAREGEFPPSRKEARGISPEKFFRFKMSVEAIQMHFETMFACEIWLIIQAFHVAVFKRVSNATIKE